MEFNRKYNEMKLKDYTEAIYGKNSNWIMNNEADYFVKILISTPFDRLAKYLTSKEHSGAEVIGDLINALNRYYEGEKKKPYYDPKYAGEEAKVFENFSKYYSYEAVKSADNEPKLMQKLLRHAYTEMVNNATIEEIKKSRKLFSKTDIAWDCKAEADFCFTLLSQQDKTLRGSSDAYKEIQKELKLLKEIMVGYGSTKADKMYLATMMKVIADKAEGYVADRSRTEFEHSIDGYKGKRINAMREVATRLKMYADYLQEDINKTEVSPKEKEDYVKKLRGKAEQITFSDRLFSEIAASKKSTITAEQYLNNPAMKAMSKGLKGKKVSLNKMIRIFNQASTDYETVPNDLAQITDNEKRTAKKWLENYRRKMNKAFTSCTAEVNLDFVDNMVYEKKDPSYFTGDKTMDAVRTAVRMDCTEKEFAKRGIELPQKDVFKRCLSEEASRRAEEAKADKTAAKAGMGEAVMGI